MFSLPVYHISTLNIFQSFRVQKEQHTAARLNKLSSILRWTANHIELIDLRPWGINIINVCRLRSGKKHCISGVCVSLIWLCLCYVINWTYLWYWSRFCKKHLLINIVSFCCAKYYTGTSSLCILKGVIHKKIWHRWFYYICSIGAKCLNTKTRNDILQNNAKYLNVASTPL